MLLAVDVGNTQTHLGAFDGERLVEHWRFQTRSGATGDELAERIAGLFSLSRMSFDDVDAVCVSSVVPPLGSQF
ncbi:MAG TPA: type III pantothenate kinase, partial [Solirubrobacterales bacterium]|nr:type III pantothenate kinase [Solirubrobacterales bacterium]